MSSVDSALLPRDAVDRAVRTVLVGAFVLAGVTAPTLLDHQQRSLLTAALAWSTAALSLVVLTGMVGQFSLAQAAFMGVGAFSAAHLVSQAHVPFMLAVPLGGAAAVPVGMIAAVPALRVGGVLLGVVTLGFGSALSSLFFQAPVNGGDLGGTALPRPSVLADDVHYCWFELAVLLALCGFVSLMRTRRTGRVLAAVRESEAAALVSGVDVVRTKVGAFALSAFIAGVAGVLYSGVSGVASAQSYDAFASIALLTVAVIGGIGSCAGAVIAGLLKTVAPYLITRLPLLSAAPDLVGVVFGAGLIVQLLLTPHGIAEGLLAAERALAAKVRETLERERGRIRVETA